MSTVAVLIIQAALDEALIKAQLADTSNGIYTFLGIGGVSLKEKPDYFGVCIRSSDFWKLPYLHSYHLPKKTETFTRQAMTETLPKKLSL